MRKLNKKLLIIPAIILGLAGTGALLYTTSIAKADNTTKQDTMAQQLSEKLGVDESKVSDAMDQIRQEKQDQMQAQEKERLDQAVTDGKINQSQEDAIIAREKEQIQKREQEREEYQQWLSDNSLDQSTLRDIGAGPMGGKMMGHGMMF